MQTMQHDIALINTSHLGFRYFRMIFESKRFSKKFIEYLKHHPNVGYVFEGYGWSGKKKILGIGLWARTNAEINDVSIHVRSKAPVSYKLVMQSELTRLEYLQGETKPAVIVDEFGEDKNYDATTLEVLRLYSVDPNIDAQDVARFIQKTEQEVQEILRDLKEQGTWFGLTQHISVDDNYHKFFIDTTSIPIGEIEEILQKVRDDERTVYLSYGNDEYNIEIEVSTDNIKSYVQDYEHLLKRHKLVSLRKNHYSSLYPQSKSLNLARIKNRFKELIRKNKHEIDLRESVFWYLPHSSAQAYLDVYSNKKYAEEMNKPEVELLKQLPELLTSKKEYTFIDLGSGDGQKGRAVAEGFGERVKSFFLVDIQPLELRQAILAHEDSEYPVHPTVIDFKDLDKRFPISGSANISMLFGGTYGNFFDTTINAMLAQTLGSNDDRLVITMPIVRAHSKQDWVAIYSNKSIETLGLGILENIGFKEDDFVDSKKSGLKVHVELEGEFVVTYFVLARRKDIGGITLPVGAKLYQLRSWKPDLDMFKKSLEKEFEVESLINNDQFALAVCKKK